MKKEQGVRVTVWLPNDLAKKVDKTRKKLGLKRSAFFRFSAVEIMKQLLSEDENRTV